MILVFIDGVDNPGNGGNNNSSPNDVMKRGGGGFGGGGGYFELTTTDDLATTFTRVADELHHQYALGFAPATLDGKVHALAVHVQLNGATGRARKSYLAATTQ